MSVPVDVEVLLKTQEVKLMMALEEKILGPVSRIDLLGTMLYMGESNFTAIHQIVVEIIQNQSIDRLRQAWLQACDEISKTNTDTHANRIRA